MSTLPWPTAKYNLPVEAAPAELASPLPGVAGPSRADDAPWWSPQQPLFWFGIVAAAAVGLMGVSTHARVGPVSASASVGK